MKKKHVVFELIVLLLTGLIPLLWFRGSEVILGHDAGLPLAPVGHVTDRLFGWTHRLGFGVDQSLFLAGIFIHGFEAIVYSFTQSLQLMQKVTFIFWFLLPGLTMYIFARRLENQFKLTYFALFTSLFYMINHFLLQGWFIAERTKFSVYAAVPLVLLLLFDWQEHKRSTLRTGLFISLVLFFLNGGGSLPLFGGFFLVVGVFVFRFLLEQKSIRGLIALAQLSVVVGVSSLLLHAYWIFPMVDFVRSNYASQVTQAGGTSGIAGWISYVSQESSYINLFRLQGIPEWYQNPSHPYANEFLTHPLLMIIAGLLPLFAFLPMYLFRKDRRLHNQIAYYALLTLVSMVFVAGYHPPFDLVYRMMIRFVPGFIAFRTPFYKFASALWFGYAILLGFFVSWVVTQCKKRVIQIVLYGAAVSVVFVYSYPFLNGIFFDYVQGERSMRVTVPQYVYDYGAWSEQSDRIGKKTLALPPPNPDMPVDQYTWGYWSLSPLTSLLTNAPVINKSDYMDLAQKQLMERLYLLMLYDEQGWLELAQFLGIESFLVRRDFLWDKGNHPTENPLLYEQVLQKNPMIQNVMSFGEWAVYDLTDTSQVRNLIEVSHVYDYLEGAPQDLAKLSGTGLLREDDQIVISSSGTNPPDMEGTARRVIVAPVCLRCDLQREPVDVGRYTPLLTKGSIFYSFAEYVRSLRGKSELTLSDRLYETLTKVQSIKKVVDEKKHESEVAIVLQDFNVSMRSLEKEVVSSIEENSISNNQQIEIENVLFTVRGILLGDINKYVRNSGLASDLADGYTSLQHTIETVRSTYWITPDDTLKRYEFVVPVEGNYTFYLNVSDAQEFSPISHITLNGNRVDLPGELSTHGWTPILAQYLAKGRNTLEINLPPNTLNVFPENYIFQTNPQGSCSSSEPINVKAGEVFRVSLNHSRRSGEGVINIGLSNSAKKAGRADEPGDVLESTYYPREYLSDYRSGYRMREIYLNICNAPYIETQTKGIFELDNIRIHKLTIPEIVLVQDRTGSANDVETSVEEVSQVEYRVETKADIQSPMITSLNQSYSKKWILQNTHPVSPIIINGYQNGWIVPSGNDSFSISFAPQKLIDAGILVSILSFAGTLVLIGIGRKSKQ